MGRRREQIFRRCGGNGLESALTFYNLLLPLSVSSQPCRPVPTRRDQLLFLTSVIGGTDFLSPLEFLLPCF